MSAARIPIRTPGGTFEVYTRRAGSHPRVKLLLLHGGPGATHEYFGEMEKLVDAEVIYYDQLGCGQSDRPDDDSLWTLRRYVGEVEQLRQALGLGPDNFYLLGHSWGGILALEYALTHGANLKGLVIANIMASMPAFNRRILELVDRELGIPRDHPEVVQQFYARYLCRQVPWPDFVARSFAETNPQVAQALRGTDPLLIGGDLDGWDRTPDLGRIAVPTLVVHGGDDNADGVHMETFARRLPRGQFLLCPHSRHLPMLDEPEVFSAGLNEFIAKVDAP